VPAAKSGVSGDLAPATSSAPAAAPETTPEAVVPDTINGELVWPDLWDKITDTDRPFY